MFILYPPLLVYDDFKLFHVEACLIVHTYGKLLLPMHYITTKAKTKFVKVIVLYLSHMLLLLSNTQLDHYQKIIEEKDKEIEILNIRNKEEVGKNTYLERI